MRKLLNVIDPVDPMSVWLSGTSHCVRTGTGTVRTDEYRYRAYRFGTGTVRTGMVPVRYYQYRTLYRYRTGIV